MPSRRVRPRLIVVSESQKRAQQAWNQGLVGKGRPATAAPAVKACPTDGCGRPADQPQPNTAMLRVHVVGSREPARWYCPGRCAAIGRALADLATINPAQGES